MNILHATTDPSLLERLKQMLGSSDRANIGVGYFFIDDFMPGSGAQTGRTAERSDSWTSSN